MRLVFILLTLASNCFAAFTERELIASILVLECGGEYVDRDGLDGLRAVREVIATRAKERRQTETEVVTARWQFSCLNGFTPEAAVARAKAHKRYGDALTIAGGVTWQPVAGGANHYHAVTIPRPYWAKGRTPCAAIGNHIFYLL